MAYNMYTKVLPTTKGKRKDSNFCRTFALSCESSLLDARFANGYIVFWTQALLFDSEYAITAGTEERDTLKLKVNSYQLKQYEVVRCRSCSTKGAGPRAAGA